MRNGKKVGITRLSLKIVLMFLVVLIVVWFLMYNAFTIMQIAGIRPSPDREGADRWYRTFMLLFPPLFGVLIIGIFVYVLNRTLVARVCRLEEATKEVASGNFDVSVEVRGNDELSDLAYSFNRMSSQLKANEYLSKEFVRNISHEYKTPLSAIRAYSELLEVELEKPQTNLAALKNCAEIITKQTDRLSLLSKSILQLSILDSTTIIKTDEDVKPAEQIRDIFRLMEAKWLQKDIKLDLSLEENTIKSNEQLLFQVWQNLISNAIKFCHQGGTIAVTLKILTPSSQNGLNFEITNEGEGIKDEDKERIFQHFFMGDASRNSEGSGLGLAITKKILTKLGGTITFESQKDQPTKFMVNI